MKINRHDVLCVKYRCTEALYYFTLFIIAILQLERKFVHSIRNSSFVSVPKLHVRAMSPFFTDLICIYSVSLSHFLPRFLSFLK